MPEISHVRDPEMQALLDKQAIWELMIRYCRGLDRMDEEILASVYHPDAHDEHGGQNLHGKDIAPGILAQLRQMNYLMGFHSIINLTITIDGDKAGCESLYSGYMLMADADGKPERTIQMMGRYLDQLERRDGEWRVSERTIVSEMSRWLAAGLEPYAPDWNLEGRQFPDPSYALLAKYQSA